MAHSSAADRSHAFTQFASQLPEVPHGYQRIYLLRHGETEWNRAGKVQGGGFDIPLNESGQQQARAASRLLAHIPLDMVASSHLKRSKVTADIVHENHPSSPQRLVDERWGEMRFGDVEGAQIRGPGAQPSMIEHVRRQHKAMRSNKSLRWAGHEGESIHDVETRARAALRSICESNPDATHIAIVAHGRTNKILLQALLNLHERECEALVQGNTCINVLDRNCSLDEYTARLINFTTHTEKEAERKCVTF